MPLAATIFFVIIILHSMKTFFSFSFQTKFKKSGEGVRFSNENWKGGIVFTSNFFGGFGFEILQFLENHRPRGT